MRILCAALVLTGLMMPDPDLPQASVVPPYQKGPIDSGAEVLQLYAGGHVLRFGQGGMVVATGSHAMKISFLSANDVAPVADTAASDTKTEGGEATALDRVTYLELWDGITLDYTRAAGGIYMTTYRLEAGADVGDIRLGYNAPLTLRTDSSLGIALEAGTFTETAPIAWQLIDGRRAAVEVAYTLSKDGVGFALGDHNPQYSVIIDPTLVWSAFLGGSGSDDALGITVDGDGNVYVTGVSDAVWGTPLRSFTAGQDAYIAKLDAAGSLIWHTFLGGSGQDPGYDIALDGSGNVYVSGYSTESWGAPLRAFTAGDDDVYVAKLDASGNLIWHTFLGGVVFDYGSDIAVDGSGNAYVTGSSAGTWGTPLRAYTAGDDAYVAKLDSSGGLLWNTFLGGTDDDTGFGLSVDGSGNAYLAGSSNAAWGSPVRPFHGSQSAFAAKLDASGSLAWHTFLGGSGGAGGSDVVVDGSGNVYVSGACPTSWGRPIRPFFGGPIDTFAAKLDSSGSLVWHTFLGGTGWDNGYGVAVDEEGHVYVGGTSAETWGTPVSPFEGLYDAYAAKLDASGHLIWNTFFGDDESDWGRDIAIDGNRNVYLTGPSEGTAFVVKLNGPPNPDILLNGSDGPVTLSRNDALLVEIELTAGDQKGVDADWWLVARTPFAPPRDFFHYNRATKTWTPGLEVSHQGPCADLKRREVLNVTGLPAGTYLIYFGVDMIMDGVPTMEEIYLQRAKVTVVR